MPLRLRPFYGACRISSRQAAITRESHLSHSIYDRFKGRQTQCQLHLDFQVKLGHCLLPTDVKRSTNDAHCAFTTSPERVPKIYNLHAASPKYHINHYTHAHSQPPLSTRTYTFPTTTNVPRTLIYSTKWLNIYSTKSLNLYSTKSLNIYSTKSPDITTNMQSTTPISSTTADTTTSRTPDMLADKLAKHGLTVETLHRVQDVFIELAEAAGTMMLNAEFDVLAQADTKNNTSDLVSDYDKAIEAMVHKRFTEEFPSFEFLGEESYTHGQKLTDEPVFIVDPVDGTINFTRGFPNFGISMALAIEKYPVVGMVYNPGQGNLWTAIENHGAFLTKELFVARNKLTDPLELKNQDPALRDAFGKLSIGVGKTAKPTPMTEKEDPLMTTAEMAAKQLEFFKPTFKTKMADLAKYKLPLTPFPPPMPSLKKRLIAIEWGNERKGPNWALRTDVHTKLLTDEAEGGKMILSCRSSGSAALDFCYVAAGFFDAFWEGGVWCWDVAAGWIMVKEAGGIVASANPGDWDPSLEGRCYFPVRASKREEQKAIVEELWGVMGDRKFVYKDKKKPDDGTVSAAETA